MTVEELIEALRKCDPASKGIWVTFDVPGDGECCRTVTGARLDACGRVELETEMPE